MKKFAFFALAGLFGAGIALVANDRIASYRAKSDSTIFDAPQVAAMPVVGESKAANAPLDFRAASKRILPSVVSIDNIQRVRSWFDGDTREVNAGQGSGVIISSKGYIVTNNHVVAGQSPKVRVHLNTGIVVPATIVGTDPRSDLAVLKIESKNLVPAELGSSKGLEVGEWVIAVGNPLGFDHTVSVGVVSSLGRSLPVQGSILVNAIQTDAAINPGNSGGALTNAAGELVGINSAIASQTGSSVGIGFAIPVDHVKRIVNDIIETGNARYGYLGVGYLNQGRNGANSAPDLGNPDVREMYKQQLGVAPPDHGFIIGKVAEASPASLAGMKDYCVILEIDQEKINNQIDFAKQMQSRRPGDSITVKFWQEGTELTKTVKLVDLLKS